MATITYILGDGGAWNGNKELMYSLRSLHQFATNVDKVVIVTDKNSQDLSWLKNVEILHFVETKNKYRNVWDKIDAFCNTTADSFIYMNDDFILKENLDMNNMPLYKNEKSLEECINPNELGTGSFSDILQNTLNALVEKGIEPHNYDALHHPMEIEPKSWLEIMSQFDKETPVCMKSLYGSVYYKGDGIPTKNKKLNKKISGYRQIENKVKNATWFSTSTGFMSVTQGRAYLQTWYSRPSRWER